MREIFIVYTGECKIARFLKLYLIGFFKIVFILKFL